MMMGLPRNAYREDQVALLPPLAEPSAAEEAYHRLANHLQMVAALISFEARSVTEAAALAALETTQRRIGAVAAIHRALCISPKAEQFDLAAYLETLCRDLEAAHGGGAAGRTILVDAKPAQVRADEGTAIGMIVTELVINALKHAYAGDEAGDIAVTLWRAPGGTLRIVVADTGGGLGSEMLGSGVGSRLVATLTRRVGGTLRRRSTPRGTRFTLDIPAR